MKYAYNDYHHLNIYPKACPKCHHFFESTHCESFFWMQTLSLHKRMNVFTKSAPVIWRDQKHQRVLVGKKKIKKDPEYVIYVQQIGAVRKQCESTVYPRKRTGGTKRKFWWHISKVLHGQPYPHTLQRNPIPKVLQVRNISRKRDLFFPIRLFYLEPTRLPSWLYSPNCSCFPLPSRSHKLMWLQT